MQQAIEESLEELQRSNAELEQFAYVASHDLQEPLRMVSNYTQLLARRYQGRLDEDADTFIGFAVEGAARMQQLINDLLEFSRVATKAKEAQPVEMDTALNFALANLTAALDEAGAKVIHGELPAVIGDDSQLSRVFQNLIGNAIKFRGPEAPVIEVTAEQDGDYWRFGVRDNGIGIAPQYSERIFVIFQRLHTRDEYAGTGIGLALCKRIVERHGGRIWVESAAGEGATFYFTLPAVERQALRVPAAARVAA
jgi:light-regulated signal transduction histidine kinase (bacteriophytochrome)